MISKLRKVKKIRVLMIALAVIICAVVSGLTFGRPMVNRGFHKLGVAVGLARPTVFQSDKPELLVVYATPNGFEPDTFNISPGKKYLMVRNRSNLDNQVYILTNAGKGNADKANAALGANAFFQYKFGDDEVTLREANHPDWVCHFKITE